MTLKKDVTIKLPGHPSTAVTMLDDRILFVTAAHDADCANPLDDCDGMGHIYSASRRHINYKSFDNLRELLGSDEDAVALSYFEHGNSMWMVKGSAASRTPGVEFRWDGVEFAGVWVPDKSCRESYNGQDGLTRKEWMVRQAEIACEEFTHWVNGECFGYSVQLYEARKDDNGEVYDRLDDYRRDTPLEDDSCWGFIGWDYFAGEMKDAALRVAGSEASA